MPAINRGGESVRANREIMREKPPSSFNDSFQEIERQKIGSIIFERSSFGQCRENEISKEYSFIRNC